MTKTSTLILASALVLFLTSFAPSQCFIGGVNFTNYGQGCTPFFSPPQISGQFDPASCTLTFSLTSSPSCCNTYLVERFFVFGLFQAAQPLPFLGPGCVSYTSADLIVVQPNSAGGDLSVLLPPSAIGITFYAQGANHFFTTIGFTHDYELSQGLRVDIF
ncbi:MAG TPA: hypothetical protein ENK43_06605 [Planctomycetes bacterium]|nr:hypothetical protein [Planctomycetota bacterium]